MENIAEKSVFEAFGGASSGPPSLAGGKGAEGGVLVVLRSALFTSLGQITAALQNADEFSHSIIDTD